MPDTVKLANGTTAVNRGKGILGRVLVGQLPGGKVICWNLDGKYRWDGQPHPFDIAREIVS